MSTIGLNTNTFRVTGKYLDLLNDFIVKAKIHLQFNEQKKEQIIDFITKIGDVNTTQPQYQLLSSIIERELRLHKSEPEAFFARLKNELEQNNVKSVLPKIEFIVAALDTENSEALAKIKGD